MDNQDLHGARVDPRPEEASLLQDRSSLLQRQSTSQGNMGDSEPPDILCESCGCIIHTNLKSCMSVIKHSTINLSLTSEESLGDSKPPVTGYLRTKGQESVYETCACVIHTNLLSYMCISIVSVISH